MYGETGAELRQELAALLRIHRIQRALESTDRRIGERRRHGAQIRRYREAVMTWCAESAVTARPLAFTNLPKAAANPFRPAAPDEPVISELIRSLDKTRAGSTAHLPDLELLTTPQSNPVVEHWRKAAKAAALAEHDTGPDAHGSFDTPQAQALLGDVAAVVQALVVLDQRYRVTPGWEPLTGVQRLGWAALACALDVGLGRPDYSIDQAGWRPMARLTRGGPKPGMLGVLQAEHDLFIRLRVPPNVTNLRRVVDSQRLVSDRLARIVARTAPDASARWRARCETYTVLQRQLRDVGGHLGKGGPAAVEGARAVSRLQHMSIATILEPRLAADFQTMFDHIDNRVADVIEDGVRRGSFVQRVTVPRVVDSARGMVHPVRERFAVVADLSDLEVITTVRGRLRPTATPPTPQPSPGPSRVDLHAALLDRRRGLSIAPDSPQL